MVKVYILLYPEFDIELLPGVRYIVVAWEDPVTREICIHYHIRSKHAEIDEEGTLWRWY